MERPCTYPGCTTTLSKFVPLQIVCCGIHQREHRRLKEKLASEKLPEEDIEFIFLHPNGCNCNQLAVHLGIPSITILGYLKSGVIKGKKDERRRVWNIPTEEIERVIILVRNWITAWKAARIAGVRDDIFLSYVKEGYFGETKIYLSGGLAIRKEQLSTLKERYKEISRARRSPKNWLKKKGWLKDGELMTSEIVKIAGITPEGVNFWIRKGQLPARRNRYCWIIQKTDFIEFAKRAVNREYPLRPRTIRALRQFLSQRNPP